MKPVLMHLLNVIDSGDIGKIYKELQKAPDISIRLLKILNSPYFSVAKEISSVKQAVVMLGLYALRKIAIMLIFAYNQNNTMKNNLIEKKRIYKLLYRKYSKNSL